MTATDVMAPVEEGGAGEAKVDIAEDIPAWPPLFLICPYVSGSTLLSFCPS